ncbi:hypothetical protein C5167_008639 [Papaver somniferum]|uniref:Uncharacterized protein n=1 Tax=Papaver somniferum TaxID=3469 RepID=A0A4Y7JV52_PAPSO|nr:hypothetical protein C5167_008639 [Papaver somniferum]
MNYKKIEMRMVKNQFSLMKKSLLMKKIFLMLMKIRFRSQWGVNTTTLYWLQYLGGNTNSRISSAEFKPMK